MEIKLSEQNEFTKTFQVVSDVSGELSMFVSKAYDEDTDAHFLVISINEFPKLGVAKIQFPIQFNSEEERNFAFDNEVKEDWVEFILPQFENQIIENKNNLKTDSSEENEPSGQEV